MSFLRDRFGRIDRVQFNLFAFNRGKSPQAKFIADDASICCQLIREPTTSEEQGVV